MPWNSPSSQPTSWACAIRSSDSLGVSAEKGSTTLPSSSWSSGERMPWSSLRERSWISRSARRPASSSGARRTSSSIVRTIDAIRISFVGRRTCSSGSSPVAPSVLAVGIPFGNVIGEVRTSGAGFCGSGLDIGATLPAGYRAERMRLGHDQVRRAPADNAFGARPGNAVELVRLGLPSRLADPTLTGPPAGHNRQDGIGDL